MMTSTHARTDLPGVTVTARIFPPAKQDAPWTAELRAGTTREELTLEAPVFDDARREVRALALAFLSRQKERKEMT